MARDKSAGGESVDRKTLIKLLNEDLAREYQAIIAYVVYSQVLKRAEYMAIAKELEVHAGEELQHALTISKQIDYLGGMPTVEPKPVKTSKKAEDMLRFDLDNETETIKHYRQRVRQCEALGELRWRNRFEKFWCKSKSIKSTWQPCFDEDVPDMSEK